MGESNRGFDGRGKVEFVGKCERFSNGNEITFRCNILFNKKHTYKVETSNVE